MGQSPVQQPTGYVRSDGWTEITQDKLLPFQNNPFAKRVLLNTYTQQYIEEYELAFSCEAELRSYQQNVRQRQSKPTEGVGQDNKNYSSCVYIYPCSSFVDTTHEDICNTLYKGLFYAPRVQLRLKEIKDLSFADQIYLFKATLQGFKILYEKVGFFDIVEEMIFIDMSGNCRVWMHPNLCEHRPLNIHKYHQKEEYGSQSEMIVKLIQTIEGNSDSQTTPRTISFKQHLQNKNIFKRLSFYRALQQLDNYCQQNYLIINDYIQSIRNIFMDDAVSIEKSDVIRFTRRDKLSQLFTPRSPLQETTKKKSFSPFPSFNIQHSSKASQRSEQSHKPSNNNSKKSSLANSKKEDLLSYKQDSAVSKKNSLANSKKDSLLSSKKEIIYYSSKSNLCNSNHSNNNDQKEKHNSHKSKSSNHHSKKLNQDNNSNNQINLYKNSRITIELNRDILGSQPVSQAPANSYKFMIPPLKLSVAQSLQGRSSKIRLSPASSVLREELVAEINEFQVQSQMASKNQIPQALINVSRRFAHRSRVHVMESVLEENQVSPLQKKNEIQQKKAVVDAFKQKQSVSVQLKNFNTKPSESAFEQKAEKKEEKNTQKDGLKQKNSSKNVISYYTPTTVHQLDPEIVKDLQLYLGFCPQKL